MLYALIGICIYVLGRIGDLDVDLLPYHDITLAKPDKFQHDIEGLSLDQCCKFWGLRAVPLNNVVELASKKWNALPDGDCCEKEVKLSINLECLTISHIDGCMRFILTR